ncbi:MAG TPA: glycosyltransferase [Gemmatimonadales bacterium]|nr:glycosyltransferase [Gemmatimonadales bacterium]
MRILHLGSGREWRGGQRQTLLLARGLAERGCDQRLITRRESELARRASESGVSIVPVSWGAGLDPRVLPTLVREARSADLIHAHDSHAVALASAASRFSGTPFIATRRMTRPLRSAGPWRRAARLIAISRSVRQSLIESGIDAQSIDVVTPAIDVAATSRVTPYDWSATPGIQPASFIVVAVSALTREKGIDLLLEAMADPGIATADVTCMVAGAGPERDQLATLARALGVAERVHFLGHVDDPLPLIAGAGVLVMPSREEAFGSTILDALALGIPVIGTEVGGIPEALSNGGGVTVPAGDSRALAAEVQRLAGDENLRETMSRNAAEAARHHDLPGMVERTLGVYRSVMERIEIQ